MDSHVTNYSCHGDSLRRVQTHAFSSLINTWLRSCSAWTGWNSSGIVSVCLFETDDSVCRESPHRLFFITILLAGLLPKCKAGTNLELIFEGVDWDKQEKSRCNKLLNRYFINFLSLYGEKHYTLLGWTTCVASNILYILILSGIDLSSLV